MITKLLYKIKIYIEVRNICEIIANYLKMKIIEKLRRGFQLKLKWKPKKRLAGMLYKGVCVVQNKLHPIVFKTHNAPSIQRNV